MKTCVIIPAYNEAERISQLIKKIRQFDVEVVVIDDGSQDNTGPIAQESKAAVIRNHTNLGKGASLIKGFTYALEEGFDAVITMDGDGQHSPSEIPNFIKKAEESPANIIIGNRMNKIKSMPMVRLWTNKFMSWLISRFAKQLIPDSQCGFRLIKKEVLKTISLKTSRYDTESEILIMASSLGFKIESMPIETIYSDEKSRINPFVDTLRFVKLLFNLKQK